METCKRDGEREGGMERIELKAKGMKKGKWYLAFPTFTIH